VPLSVVLHDVGIVDGLKMGLGLMNPFETRYIILIMMASILLNAVINENFKLGVDYIRPVLRHTSMEILSFFMWVKIF
jgi:hypothetical protein